MKIKEILESSSGGTTSGSIATAITGSPSSGQFFGGDFSSSIYGPIKKKRKYRKNRVIEDENLRIFLERKKRILNKAKILGSDKPYYEPNVLGPTTLVQSTGKILGGREIKNPTLSKKFFGSS